MQTLMQNYLDAKAAVDEIRAAHPELAKAEKVLEKAKKALTDYAKEHNDQRVAALGYWVDLSPAVSWNNTKLEGYMITHPDVEGCRTVSYRATIKREKQEG